MHEQVKQALDKNTTAICNEKHQSHVMAQTERTSQEIEDNPLSSGGHLSNGATLVFFYLFPSRVLWARSSSSWRV
jgi:hypothetical protein